MTLTGNEFTYSLPLSAILSENDSLNEQDFFFSMLD